MKDETEIFNLKLLRSQAEEIWKDECSHGNKINAATKARSATKRMVQIIMDELGSYLDGGTDVDDNESVLRELAEVFVDIWFDNFRYMEEEKAGYNPKVITTSELAKVEIAAKDYNIGGTEKEGKHYFTFDEAQEVQKSLKDTGWRLPTRSEWTLICEEFGQKDGDLDCETLYNNLNMAPTGWLSESGDLYGRTTGGHWWSGTASSATYGRGLDTWSGRVNAQSSGFRGYGFALRLVRDVKEDKK